MKSIQLFCIFLIILFSGCGFKDRDKQLQAKEEELSQKRQELILWEQRLNMMEKELNTRKQLLDSDSSAVDATPIQDVALNGKWAIKMQCIETSCDGSAIGDSKTETWEITSTENQVVAKVFSGKKLSRIYNGAYKQNALILVDDQSPTESVIKISLRLTPAQGMEGSREIIQENCKIIYSLAAKKI